METKEEWFERWFDSPYYHVLYQGRDESEARSFLDHLVDFLHPATGAKMLDVACGKGRHSIYLYKKGFDVTGFDLSPENLVCNIRYKKERLAFFQHDMREVFRINYFDYVLNLFSSFGYFKDEGDNAKTIYANATALKPGGFLVLDYMNSSRVKKMLVTEEEKTINGIAFHISKKIENRRVIKKINFNDHDHPYEFYEQLCLFGLADFEKYFSTAQLTIIHVFGDYNLNAFNEDTSERLILIAKKTE